MTAFYLAFVNGTSSPVSSLPMMGWYESTDVAATATYQPRIDNMAALGFELVLNYQVHSDGVYRTDAQIAAYANYLNSKGVKAIWALSQQNWWNGTIPTTTVSAQVMRMKDFPNTYGYYVFDEAIGTAAATQVSAHVAFIRSIDPDTNHVIFGAHYPNQYTDAGTAGTAELFTSQSVIGLDHYPWGQFATTAAAMTQVCAQIPTILDFVQSTGKPFLFVAQANNVPASYPALSASWPYPQWPTVDQMKWQRDTILALCSNRGITVPAMLWYSYYDLVNTSASRIDHVASAAFAAYP